MIVFLAEFPLLVECIEVAPVPSAVLPSVCFQLLAAVYHLVHEVLPPSHGIMIHGNAAAFLTVVGQHRDFVVAHGYLDVAGCPVHDFLVMAGEDAVG